MVASTDRFVDLHLLEAALQRGVLLDVLAVFVERGGADAMQFAARQRRLQHVAGVDRALGLAGADHGVHLVDEEDDAALVLRDFLQHGLQPLLEFAAVLGAGQQARHVEHQHALFLQGLRHFAIDDALRQAFDDGGLADAGFADQHRVVLGAALQDLDGTADLVVAADHRVELALAGALGQVEAILVERFALAFGVLRTDVLAAAHGLHRVFQRLAVEAGFLQQTPGLALVLGQRQQEHFGGDELVAGLLRFLVGDVEQVGQVAADADLAAVAFDLGQAIQGLGQCRLQPADIGSGTCQQGRRAAVLLVEQGQQQVLRLDELLVVADRQALGVGDGLLEPGRKFVEAHGGSLKELSFPATWGLPGRFQSSIEALAKPATRPAVPAGPGGPARPADRGFSC